MSRSKSVEPDFSHIRNVVTIGIGQIHDLSFRAGQHAISECQQAVAELQMRRVDRSLVHATIGIGVFQKHDL